MASMTSVISLFILLLATYSYSAPVVQENEISKWGYETTTSETNMRFVSGVPSTTVPNRQKVKSSESNSDETTTQLGVHSPRKIGGSSSSEEVTTQGVSRLPRKVDESNSDDVTTQFVPRPLRGTGELDSDDVTTQFVPRPLRGAGELDSDEVTTQVATRSPRSVGEVDSDEVTTEVVTHLPRKFGEVDSDEVTTEVVTHLPRKVGEVDSDEVTTEVVTHLPRKFGEVDSDEVTTEGVTRPSRTIEDSSVPSSTESDVKRGLEDYLFTTIESSTEFDRRAIRLTNSREEEIQATTPFSEKQWKTTTTVEPSSSFDSFGKYTGLLRDDVNDKRSSTPETDKNSRSSEELTTQSVVQSPRSTKTVAVIPGKVTETQIYTNKPGKTSVTIESADNNQLSQGQKQLVTEETKSNN